MTFDLGFEGEPPFTVMIGGYGYVRQSESLTKQRVREAIESHFQMLRELYEAAPLVVEPDEQERLLKEKLGL